MQSITFSGGTIHQFSSPENGFLVNSYIVEFKGEIVLIDTQFILSEANKLKAEIINLNKPLSAIFITHPHPDHFNGTALFVNAFPAVKIYATQATSDRIKNIEAGKGTIGNRFIKRIIPMERLFQIQYLLPANQFISVGVNFL